MASRRGIDWDREAPRAYGMHCSGMLLRDIGARYGVTGTTVFQALRRRGYDTSKVFSPLPGTENYPLDLQRIMHHKYVAKVSNTRNDGRGLEWSITPGDLEWPLYCPILGIKLRWEGRGQAGQAIDDAPSFDRIDSTKGYVPGNVIICSNRANRIKNNSTLMELKKIVEFLENRKV